MGPTGCFGSGLGELAEGGAPVATDDVASINEVTPLVISAASLLANDSDLDTLSVQSFTRGADGTVLDNGDGTFTYIYSGGQVGTDIGTVTVSAVNDAPVAGDDAVSTSEVTLLVISAASLLANDGDLDTLWVQSFTRGADGTVVDNGDGTFTYTPNADFNGVDSFTYIYSGGQVGTETIIVTLNVNPVNDNRDKDQ